MQAHYLKVIPSGIGYYYRERPFRFWLTLSFILHLSIILFLGIGSLRDLIYNKNFNDFKNLPMVDFKPPKGLLSGTMNPNDAPELKGTDGDGKGKGEDSSAERPVRYGVEWGEYGDIFNTTIPPLPVTATRPKYPQALRKAAIEGVVVVEVGVDEKGTVLYAKVVKSPEREFSYAVIDWIKEIKFRPALDKEKKPFRCRIRLPIRFKLED